MPELSNLTFTEEEKRRAWGRGYELCGELPIPEREGWKIIALLTRVEGENAQLKQKLEARSNARLWKLVDTLHGLVKRMGHHYKGALPYPHALSDGHGTRTQLAFIERTLTAAETTWSQAKSLLNENPDEPSSLPSETRTAFAYNHRGYSRESIGTALSRDNQ